MKRGDIQADDAQIVAVKKLHKLQNALGNHYDNTPWIQYYEARQVYQEWQRSRQPQDENEGNYALAKKEPRLMTETTFDTEQNISSSSSLSKTLKTKAAAS